MEIYEFILEIGCGNLTLNFLAILAVSSVDTNCAFFVNLIKLNYEENSLYHLGNKLSNNQIRKDLLK